MKFSIKNFFSKCRKIHRKLRIRSQLLEISLMENLIFCAVKSIGRKTLNIKLTGIFSFNKLIDVTKAQTQFDLRFFNGFKAFVDASNRRRFFLLKVENTANKKKISLLSRKFYIRRNSNNIDSIETGCIVIPHLLP